VLQGLGGNLLAGEHAADLSCARGVIQFLDGRHRTPLQLVLFDQIVMVGEASDLGEVRDTEHLVVGREFL